jgi:CRISPR-associated protein Csd1
MIHALRAYALSQNLDAEPGFSPKSAKWAIQCNQAGRYLGVIALGDTAQKQNKGRQFLKCPSLTQPEMKAGGAGTRHFLLDSNAVVALWGKEAGTEKAAAKHANFNQLLQEAANHISSLVPVAKCLSDPAQVQALRDDLAGQKAAETDNITFLIDDLFPVDNDDWHDWWRSHRQRFSKTVKSDEVGEQVPCFLRGELVKPATTHEKITGLSGVGGLPMGDVLIGFKQESFCSFGFEQAANAAMSTQAVKSYQTGLNHLIANGQSLAGARIAHWFRQAIPSEDDPFNFLLDPSDIELDARDRAKKLLNSIRGGERSDLANNTSFAITISGAAGRVMVRDWMEGAFEQLAASIAAWFDDMALIEPEGRGLARSPKFMAVLGSTVRDLDNLTSPFVARMWRVAVRNEPIPSSAHAQALTRARMAIVAGDPPRVAGIALLKAFHLRQGRQQVQKENPVSETLQPELNPDHPSIAYQCGRLMAVLSRLQESALPNVKSGIVQRSYAAASTTPALILGRLIRTAQFHKDKVASDRPGLAAWFDRQISEIMTHIHHQPPAALSLEEQSLFAIGYYQQLAYRSEKKEEGPSND